jgi:hypothetical protein
MSISHQDILAIVVAASFAAGLNVYATVATLGLLSHAHLFELPPALHLLQSWPVIVVCVVLFSLEFVGDKIPVFDLIWNALNTFVRVPVAVLISFGATEHLSPLAQAAAAALGGALALAAHSGKIALRTAVTPSPEPVSNAALSFGEDLVCHQAPDRRNHYRGCLPDSGDSGGALRHPLGATTVPTGPFQPACKSAEFDVTAPRVRPFAVPLL